MPGNDATCPGARGAVCRKHDDVTRKNPRCFNTSCVIILGSEKRVEGETFDSTKNVLKRLLRCRSVS